MHRFAAMVALVASASACERATPASANPLRWVPPQVGDRVAGTYDSETELEANSEDPPDAHHTTTSHREFIVEVRAVAAEKMTEVELKETAKRTVNDGVLEQETLSTIVGTKTPAGISIVVDGKVEPHPERAGWFSGIRQAIEGEPGRKKFWLHPFVRGERYRVTADEAFGIGFGDATVDVVVRTIDSHAIVFDTETTGTGPSNVTLHSRGTWTHLADTDDRRCPTRC